MAGEIAGRQQPSLVLVKGRIYKNKVSLVSYILATPEVTALQRFFCAVVVDTGKAEHSLHEFIPHQRVLLFPDRIEKMSELVVGLVPALKSCHKVVLFPGFDLSQQKKTHIIVHHFL